MLFLGIKKIPLKEKYAFIVLEIFDLNRGDIHRGICAQHDGMEKKIHEVSCLFMAISLIYFVAQTAYYHI